MCTESLGTSPSPMAFISATESVSFEQLTLEIISSQYHKWMGILVREILLVW